MKLQVKTTAAALLAVSLMMPSGFAEDAAPAKAKKPATAKKSEKKTTPSVEEQIEKLRTELEGQINGLRSSLAEKDVQLKQAQQSASDAQAAAAKAQEAANVQQQAVSENASAVNALQSTVTDMKAANVNVVATISDETAALKKAVANPSVLHYKGIELTPGGFVAAETVNRSKATGGDIPTAFSSIPYETSDNYKLSEFYGTGRQSRLSLLATGKTSWGTMRGYYEADFLGTGTTSNNNQSNSYVLRQRAIFLDATTNSGWTFAGGQMWSLISEGKKGISSLTSDVNTPQTIDANYVPGFIWARQYGFRVVKNFKKSAFGVSFENPQLLYSAALANDTPYAVLGSAGTNGGNYNATISSVSAKTYIQKYTDQALTTTSGVTTHEYVANYNTVTANTNIANISFNYAPDIIVKAAFDPGWGHYEVFGVVGFGHETVYPGVTTNSVLYGGVTDNVGYNGAAPGTAFTASSTSGAIANSILLGGGGASVRLPLIKDKLSFGAKGLYGSGTGRYGDSTLSDVTNNAWGGLAPIHNLSGLLTLEANPTPRLALFLNYGGDYAARADYAYSATTVSPNAYFCESGVTLTTANVATYCASSSASNLATLMTAGGKWGTHFTGAQAMTAVGYGSRYASTSACTSTGSPSYNTGSSTGYQGSTGCGLNTRDVQEVTGGYWYDLYKGDRGRLRQGLQYGYAVREGWSGASGVGSKGIDNMVFTTLRYYLP